MLKSMLKSSLRTLGYDVVKYPPMSPLVRQLRALFERKQINLVLDVGACDGGYARFLRGTVGYRGRIVSFEPARTTFDKLCANMQSDPDWHGYNIGLSDENTTGRLNTYGERPDFNSLLTLRQNGAEAYGVNLKDQAIQEVQLRTIDSLWDELTVGRDNPRIYLKIDTQGHEPSVIRGALPRMQHIIGMQAELPAVRIYDGMQPMLKTLELVTSLGFVPTGFHPVNQPDYYDGLVPEFDTVFLKNERW